MLSEMLIAAGGWGLVLACLMLIVKLVLGSIIVIRARRQDLPKIAHDLAGWFFRRRR